MRKRMALVTAAPPGPGRAIRALREARGWTATQLARRARVNQSTLSRIESGETLSGRAGTIDRLALALGVHVSAIMGREPPPRAVPIDLPEQRHQVQLVRVPTHAGRDWTTQTIGWEATGETVAVDEQDARGRQLLAARVLGECMVPDVMPGDVVVFDAWNRMPQNGEMVVVTHERELLVRWARQTPGGLLLIPNHGETFIANGDTIVEGVVYEVIRRQPRKRWDD
ncbi:MAG: LexA family transcriptional regulator [Thermoleophilia bacterium]|nr:LexA family transcriptional regulator [Thermoleophilia bacterium]